MVEVANDQPLSVLQYALRWLATVAVMSAFAAGTAVGFVVFWP